MNKKILALSLAMAFSGLVGVSHATQEASVTEITLTGHVTDYSACEVDAPSSVSFNDISIYDIGTVESGKPYKNNPGAVYDIVLTKCPTGQNVSVSIMGNADAENSSLIALDAVPGSAQHVAISFWDENLLTQEHVLIKANSGSSNVHSTESYGGARIPLYVAPTQTTDSQKVVPGTINATTNVKVNFL